MTTGSPTRSRFFWLTLTLAGAVGFGTFLVPAFIIRPFTHQSARGLFWAMTIRGRAPLVSLLCAVACALLALWGWNTAGRWARAGMAVIVLLGTASAVMSRLNYFEWMFHPVDSPRFEAESGSKLAAGEMILALRFGSDARAYPIREMAYHHILNDVVGGVPVAVTY